MAAGWWRWLRALGERPGSPMRPGGPSWRGPGRIRLRTAVLNVAGGLGQRPAGCGGGSLPVDERSPSGATPACSSRWLASVWGRFSWRPRDVLPGDLGLEEVLRERLGDLGVPVSGSAGAPGWIAGPADPAVNQGRHRSDGGHKKRAPTGTLRLDSITETDAIKRGSNFSSQRQRSLCS